MIEKMKRLIYFLFLFGFLFSSCVDDLAVRNENNVEESFSDAISVAIDLPEVRTRVVDMTPGAAIYLNDIWVGVYRKSDGVRVGGAKVDLGNRLAASGVTIIDLVKLDFNGTQYKSGDKYCVVGVANYDGIKITNTNISGTPSGDVQADDLIFALENANNWKDFINIAIDTQKSVFMNQSPMLMGYLYKENSNNTGSGYIFTKVNQFVDDNDTKVNLYPFGVNSQYVDTDIFVNDKTTSGRITSLNTSGYVLKLRRMRSKINVEVETRDNQMVITNLQYKVGNVPKSAFLAQRRTNVFNYTSPEAGYTFETSAGAKSKASRYSSNSSDVLNDGYIEIDEDWQKTSANNTFSYEHFENKHWAYYTNGLADYHDREKTNADGSMMYLVGNSGNGPEWNDNASYFIIRMNLRDEKEGRNAEVEYIIHEGFCSDKDGVTLVDENGETLSGNLGQRLMDFSCIRNTDYYYKIKVLDVNKIQLQVTTSNHQNDQSGKIWQINYLTPDKKPVESINSKEVTIPVKLKPDDDSSFTNQDIAFRLVGTYYDEEVRQEFNVDLCYNFSHGDLDGFAGIWPQPSNENSDYFVNTTDKEGNPVSAYEALSEYCNGTSPNAKYFNKLRDQIKVKHNGQYVDIVEYIKNIQDNDITPDIEGFKFEGLRMYVGKSSESDKSNIRGLYIFDLQKAIDIGSRIETDASQHGAEGACSYFYQIKGIEQLPVYLAREDFEMIYVKNNNGAPTTPSHFAADANNVDVTNYNNGHNGTGMLLSVAPDLAFRIVGFNENNIDYINTTDYYDIWYNIRQDEYTDFTETYKWPARNLNGILSKEIAKGYLNPGDIPESFLEGIKVIRNTSEIYTLYDFLNKYETGQIILSPSDKIGFQVNSYDVSVRVPNINSAEKKDQFKRALYLLDKKNKNVIPPLFNEASNTATFQAYGVEQDPTLKGQLTLTVGNVTPSGSHTTKTYTNILDPEIDQIKIEGLKYAGNLLPTTDYRLRLYSGAGTAMREIILTPELGPDGYFTFNIPMIALSGRSGTLYLQALSQIGDEYFSEVFANSAATSIGTYGTLSNPPTWNYLTGDYRKAYLYFQYYGSTYQTSYNPNDSNSSGPLDYLTFTGGAFGVSGNNITLRSNSSNILCKLYKPCNVEVVSNSGGGVDLCIDSEVKAFGTGTVTYTVTKDDFGDKKVVELKIKRHEASTTGVDSIRVYE